MRQAFQFASSCRKCAALFSIRTSASSSGVPFLSTFLYSRVELCQSECLCEITWVLAGGASAASRHPSASDNELHAILPGALHIAAADTIKIVASRAARDTDATSAALPTSTRRHKKVDSMPLAQLSVPLHRSACQILSNEEAAAPVLTKT